MVDRQVEAEDGQGILKDKVGEYKRAHPESLPEIDYAFMLKSLGKVNEASKVKVARNAFSEMREWIPGTETWNVGRVYLSDDHCVTFTLNKGDKVMSVEQLLDALEPINKKLPLKSVPIKLEVTEEKVVQITDLYAHSLVSEKWAGMPVDFVLCYVEKKGSSGECVGEIRPKDQVTAQELKL